jgi:hypothetical protein
MGNQKSPPAELRVTAPFSLVLSRLRSFTLSIFKTHHGLTKRTRQPGPRWHRHLPWSIARRPRLSFSRSSTRQAPSLREFHSSQCPLPAAFLTRAHCNTVQRRMSLVPFAQPHNTSINSYREKEHPELTSLFLQRLRYLRPSHPSAPHPLYLAHDNPARACPPARSRSTFLGAASPSDRHASCLPPHLPRHALTCRWRPVTSQWQRCDPSVSDQRSGECRTG